MVNITDMKKLLAGAIPSLFIAILIQKYTNNSFIILFSIGLIILVYLVFGITYDNVWGIYSNKIPNTYQKVYEMYNSKEMTKSKIKLTEWLRENSIDKYEKQINLPKEKQAPSFDGVDEARRYISDCFRYIWEVCSKDEIKRFVYANDVALLIDIVWPMELKIGIKLDKRPDRKRFQFFSELYEKELEWYK